MKRVFTPALHAKVILRALAPLMLLTAVWSTAFATDPFPPTKIYQEDGVWRVDYLSGSSIDVYYQDDQAPRFRFWIEFDLPREEYEKYVSKTTAGPDWAPYAIHYFITILDQPYFCARTWWGRRILINLVDLKHASDGPHEELLRATEQRWILDTLAGAVKHVPAGKDARERREIKQILTAVYQAGRMQIPAAVPLLKQLELSEHVSHGGGIMSNRGLSAGDIHPLQYRSYTIRRMAQRSLRGLGTKPREDLPSTQLHYLALRRDVDTFILDTGRPYQPRKHTALRHERVLKLRMGMKPVDVLDTLGPPDQLVIYRDQWRYDIDADPPYSLLVTWKDYRIASKIEKVRPPLWWRTDDIDEHAKPVGWKASDN